MTNIFPYHLIIIIERNIFILTNYFSLLTVDTKILYIFISDDLSLLHFIHFRITTEGLICLLAMSQLGMSHQSDIPGNPPTVQNEKVWFAQLCKDIVRKFYVRWDTSEVMAAADKVISLANKA